MGDLTITEFLLARLGEDEPYFALAEYQSGHLGGKAMSDEVRLAFLAGFRAARNRVARED